MKHVNANIGDYYWTVRSMAENNAVCLVRVKIVDIDDVDQCLYGKHVLCATARDKNEPRSARLSDNTEAVHPFWTYELFLYDTVDIAMDKLQLAINDGIKEMKDFFQAMRDKGTEPNTRNQIIMFPLDIIDVKDVKPE